MIDLKLEITAADIPAIISSMQTLIAQLEDQTWSIEFPVHSGWSHNDNATNFSLQEV